MPEFSCKNKTQMADLILHNGTIYTVDKEFSIAECIAIKDGKILAVGKNKDILKRFEAKENLDLQGKCVYPGFIDAHCHFYEYGLSLAEADLTGTSSFEEVLGRIAAHRREFPSPAWITGRGWDQNDWENKNFPRKAQLDRLFPGTPALLRRIDGHAALANTAALEIAGIHAGEEIEGGAILTENNEITGILIDHAIERVAGHIPDPSEEEMAGALLAAQKDCFSVGLTSVHDAGLAPGALNMIDPLNRSGKLHIRIYAMLVPEESSLEQFMHRGVFRTPHLHVRSVKLYADGALGSRGALLLEPYSDDPGNYGLSLASRDELAGICKKALHYGYQVNTHCIGDSAVRTVLAIYGSLLKEPNDLRWRIEHAQVVDPADLELFGRYSVIPSIQTTHCPSDMPWAPDRLGPERTRNAYTFRDLFEQNGWLCNGSDFPVESINPLLGFYAAIARKDLKGYPPGGYQPENALSREQAMRSMTIWAAKAAFEEDVRGSIEEGKMADLAITAEDLMNIPEAGIPSVSVLQTYIGGRCVYRRKY